MSEADLLHDHGTVAFELTAGSLISAAELDLRHRAANVEAGEGVYRFAFVARHVRKAKTARDLILLALQEPGHGEASGKLNTRRVYAAKTALARLEGSSLIEKVKK